ncbi:BON domain-containing protein [Aurantiacibacter hainanensis]|uniref:BON domain-containing protein n=1 Tax=Aurantiacibacter hainanensis TaxID=3076114 RepID=UPI0030C6FFB5
MADKNRRNRGQQAGYFEDDYGRQEEQFYQPQGQAGESYQGDYDEVGYRDDFRRNDASRGLSDRQRGQGRRGREYDPFNEYDRDSYRSQQSRSSVFGGRDRSRGFYRDYDRDRGERYGQRSDNFETRGDRHEGRYGGRNRDRDEYRDRDRDFFDRAGDEIASWFGDDEAERRREMDHRREHGRGRYEAYERGEDHRGRGPSNYKRSDERMLEDACEHLTRDRGVDASDMEVTVKNGELTLDGKVNTRWEKRRAEDCVHKVSGIGHVQNNLRVRDTEMRADRQSEETSSSRTTTGSSTTS